MIRIEDAAGDQSRPDVAAIARTVGVAAYEWQLGADTIAWSEGGAALMGTEPAQIATGRAYAQNVSAEGRSSRFDTVTKSGWRDEGDGVPYQVQYAFHSASGTRWIEDTGRWFGGPKGEPVRAVGVVRDISERHDQECRLIQRAQFDPVTGELNRLRLVELLESTLNDAERFRTSCGFLLVAINNLGRLNQAYGYSVVDNLIAEVGKRIRTRMRGKDSLGLFSGNKFGLILNNCSPEELDTAAERLLAAVRGDVILTSAGPIAVTITIGGVTAPRYARTVEDILSRAQDALDHARSKRQGSFYAYRPNVELDAVRRENVRATDEIVTALNERRIAVAYEPVIDAKTREVAFYECLMRVQRSDGTLAQAHEIIPVAERVGLVRMLDHRVLELVVNELVASPALEVSINVSPSSTLDPGWWDGLGAMLKAHPGVAERLIVEITETTAIQNIDDARGFVSRVKDLGCHIAIDDFGAGYTSFRNLRKLGVDLVKIDGAFVQNMCNSEDDRAFVRALIDLSRRLGLKIVAEWVQDEETAALLTEWGCDYLQGALVGLASSHRPWRAEQALASSA